MGESLEEHIWKVYGSVWKEAYITSSYMPPISHKISWMKQVSCVSREKRWVWRSWCQLSHPFPDLSCPVYPKPLLCVQGEYLAPFAISQRTHCSALPAMLALGLEENTQNWTLSVMALRNFSWLSHSLGKAGCIQKKRVWEGNFRGSFGVLSCWMFPVTTSLSNKNIHYT